jgi:DNA-binding GntR family transcriptional regulator
MMMEAKAMVLCLERSRTDTARKLVEANSRMNAACESQNSKALAESDTAFHMTFFEGCANKYLQQAYSLVSGRITALRTHLVNPNTGISPQAVKEHSEIIDAFVAGDLSYAERVLSAHIYKMHRNYELWKASLPKVEEKNTSTRKSRK